MKVFGQSVSYTEAGVLLVLLVLFTYRIFIRKPVDATLPTSTHMDDALPGEITKLSTEWGDVFVRVFDPVKNGFTTTEQMKATTSTPIVCLPGINAKLVGSLQTGI